MIGRLFHRRDRWKEDASAYVDGELSAARRAAFRHDLVISAELRQEVEDLRATKAILATLPAPEPRRTYTLTPELAGRRARPRPRGGVLAGMRTAAAVSTIAMAALAAVLTVDLTADETPRLAANGESAAAALAAPQAPAASLDASESAAVTQEAAQEESALETKLPAADESSPAITARLNQPITPTPETAITTEAEDIAPSDDDAVAALPPAPVAAGATPTDGTADVAEVITSADRSTSNDDWLLVLELALGGVAIAGIAAMFWLRRRGTV